ncbi:MAG: DUF393 domain-containing protein, partial [Actinobacteria bacterium]|nr:DUF393 domain-containing protein [Actinomycetota bacterium]
MGVNRCHTEYVNQALPLLVFDGDCAFCTRCVRFIERRMRRHPRIEPWQSLDLAALNLTSAQCETAVQWVDAQGAISSANIAISRLLVSAGSGWRILGFVLMLPGIRQVSAVVYRWVAKNRDRMPGGTA